MPFDWFTIAAQSLNFLVLLWLLKRFLYHPILKGLDAREQRLKSILENANHKQEYAENLQKEFERRQQELEQQRNSILKKAHEDAAQERKALFSSAQQAADDMLSKRLESLQNELIDLQHEVLNRNVDEVYLTVKKILKDLADTELDQLMVAKFIHKFTDLNNEQYTAFLEALERANNLVHVSSAFELSDKLKEDIKHALEMRLSNQDPASLSINFACIPRLLSGLELRVGGWKLAWTTEHYLDALQTKMNDAFKLELPSRVTEKRNAGLNNFTH